jgi:hypothetical protein
MQKKPTKRPRNNRQNSSSLVEFATPASVFVDGCRTLILHQNLAELTSQALKDWRAAPERITATRRVQGIHSIGANTGVTASEAACTKAI